MKTKRRLFGAFGAIESILEEDVIEISIKQSGLKICVLNRVTIEDLTRLDNITPFLDIKDVTTFQDALFITGDFVNIDDIDFDNEGEKQMFGPFFELIAFITKLRDSFCSCPMLEYVISRNYIKVFIDLPNVKTSKLVFVDEYLEDEGVIEVSAQRPYLLYVYTGDLE